ncbi:MAG: glycosyltransferase [Candidatus Babeliales bacterium]|jgi:colanic acid/amylovoran/stewartan biosynthesis glycosyltransferase WcaL/AmsK/CpsK
MFYLKRAIYIILLIISSSHFIIAQLKRRPLKILIFETYFPPRTSTAVLNQITGLIDRGYEVWIYAKSRGDMERAHPDITRYGLMERVFFNKKKKICEVSRPTRPRLCNYLRKKRGAKSEYKKKIRKKRSLYNLPPDLDTFDIIYCPFGYRGLEFLEVFESKKIKAKFVTGFRGADLTRDVQHDPHKYDTLFKQCDLFLPVCDYFKQKLMEFGCTEEKIIVLHSAIDCKLFSFQQRKFPKKRTIQIVSICRFVEKKGLEYAIKAIAQLLKYHKNIQYRIIGSGPLKDKLLDLIQELGVQDQIKLIGQVSQSKVVSFLKKAHIFLLPCVTAQNGDEEGIPNSVKEAMAMGLIPISTYHAGIPELIKNNSGFLVPSKDIPALVEKINYLIRYPKIWSKMSLLGRKIIEEEYEKEYINDQLEQIFQQLAQ